MQIHFPTFTSSDEELNITYNYRCEVYQRHVKKTPDGHVITEFLPDVPWGGKYNTISCAASHHFRDGRWLHETFHRKKQRCFVCMKLRCFNIVATRFTVLFAVDISSHRT